MWNAKTLHGAGARPLHRADPYRETPSQTAGPYVHIGLVPSFAGVKDVLAEEFGSGPLHGDAAKGERIAIEGRVFDGAGAPVRDGLVELWQADAAGLHPSPAETRGTADPDFRGWGRCPCDGDTGRFRFETIKPGSVPLADGTPQAPHVSLWIVARGINIGLQTRLYFADEADANARDPILSRIEPGPRRDSLIAQRDGDVYAFDIHLQGEHETVFLDI